METPSVGGLVKVADGGRALDGIVFDTPSKSKAVVAVVQAGRGPVLRTVPATSLTERTEDSPDDRALRLLIRRTPPPAQGASPVGSKAGQAHSGHSRSTAHRTTGR